MEKFVIFTFLAVVGYTLAYDFDDNAFNNMLTDTLDEGFANYYQSPFSVRNRRAIEAHDGKCYFHSNLNCCGESSEIELSDAGKEMKIACFKENFSKDDFILKPDLFNCENIEKIKNKIVCMANCVAEKGKVIENGEINKEVVKTLIETTFQGLEDFKKEMLEPTIDKCIPIAKTAAENAKTECSPLALKFFHCMWRTIQLDCPADKIQKTPICDKILEVLKANDQ